MPQVYLAQDGDINDNHLGYTSGVEFDISTKGWGVLELGDEVGEKELGEKRIGVGVALQVEKNLDGAVGNMEGMDGGEV